MVVENKVTGATAGAGAGTVIANFVLWAVGHYGHVTIDAQLIYYVNVASAALAAFVGGFLARHTFREDLGAAVSAAENVVMGGQQAEVQPEVTPDQVVNPAEQPPAPEPEPEPVQPGPGASG